MNKKRYYVYSWVNPDTNTPFYIGKGTDTRAINFHQSGRCENKRQKLFKKGYTNEQIVNIIQKDLTEKEALLLEKKLIEQYKRIEDGGLLFNYKICNEKGYKIIDPKIIENIKDLYINKRLTAKAIGKKINLHETSVLRYLRLANIKTYNRGSRFKFNQKEVKDIINLYKAGFSAFKISQRYNCSVPTICIVLKQNKIVIRGKKKITT
jgi:hypothetical protein